MSVKRQKHVLLKRGCTSDNSALGGRNANPSQRARDCSVHPLRLCTLCLSDSIVRNVSWIPKLDQCTVDRTAGMLHSLCVQRPVTSVLRPGVGVLDMGGLWTSQGGASVVPALPPKEKERPDTGTPVSPKHPLHAKEDGAQFHPATAGRATPAARRRRAASSAAARCP